MVVNSQERRADEDQTRLVLKVCCVYDTGSKFGPLRELVFVVNRCVMMD